MSFNCPPGHPESADRPSPAALFEVRGLGDLLVGHTRRARPRSRPAPRPRRSRGVLHLGGEQALGLGVQLTLAAREATAVIRTARCLITSAISKTLPVLILSRFRRKRRFQLPSSSISPAVSVRARSSSTASPITRRTPTASAPSAGTFSRRSMSGMWMVRYSRSSPSTTRVSRRVTTPAPWCGCTTLSPTSNMPVLPYRTSTGTRCVNRFYPAREVTGSDSDLRGCAPAAAAALRAPRAHGHDRGRRRPRARSGAHEAATRALRTVPRARLRSRR